MAQVAPGKLEQYRRSHSDRCYQQGPGTKDDHAIAATDIEAMVAFAKEKAIDFVVVAPERIWGLEDTDR